MHAIPAFLVQGHSTVPSSFTIAITDLEARPTVLVVTMTRTIFEGLFLQISSLQKIIRITEYCKRVFANIKPNRIEPSTAELKKVIILAVQRQMFADELMRLLVQTHKGTRKLRGLNSLVDYLIY